jgi:hypothetical protein
MPPKNGGVRKANWLSRTQNKSDKQLVGSFNQFFFTASEHQKVLILYATYMYIYSSYAKIEKLFLVKQSFLNFLSVYLDKCLSH